MEWSVTFYTNPDGDTPVQDFLFSLPDKERSKFFAYLQLLLERGNTLPSQYAKHIDGDLWELRPEVGGTEFRYFYFTMVGQLIVFVHAIKKKSQKTKPRDLALARKRMEELNFMMHMTSGGEEAEEARVARVRAKVKNFPRAADLLAEERQDPAFAAMYEEDLAALRLGLALCEARESLGLTQQEVGARANVPQETLSRIERGRMPSLGTLQKIADALGVQVILRPGQAVTVEPFSEQKAA